MIKVRMQELVKQTAQANIKMCRDAYSMDAKKKLIVKVIQGMVRGACSRASSTSSLPTARLLACLRF